MPKTMTRLDGLAVALTDFVIRFRWPVIIAAVLCTLALGSGGARLAFENNYRVFFSKENPELTAFEDFQATYTKNDNIFFLLIPSDGVVFQNDVLAAVDELTDAAWRIPYALRVDSITNFQHTYATEDDLIVQDLVADPRSLSDAQLSERKEIALAEPLLINQLITPDAGVTAINVTLQYPEQDINEVPDAAAAARAIAADIEARYPDIEVALTGVSMLNNAFQEAGVNDMATLVPVMFLVILIMCVIVLRSFSATFATLVVIVLSTVSAMGIAGFIGFPMTPIAGAAPIVILTLAVADSVHILLSMRAAMREGMDKRAALIEAMRVNFLAVSITSLTTIVGFLALNFSDAPPFRHLGNISAIGIAAAWLLSITVLPALVSLLPFGVKAKQGGAGGVNMMERFANFVIDHRQKLLLTVGAAAAGLVALIPTMEFNDQWSKYFDERIEFRRDTDVAAQYLGIYPIEFSVPALEPGGVSEPEFLENLDAFANYLRDQPSVVHVYSLTDIMKRLNKNMNADDNAFYRLPDDRELAAQYLLLYELSLPYGLDLNDRINIDKSATRLTVTLGDVTSEETKVFLNNANAWIAENLPEYMQTRPTSAQVMFTYITDRNVSQMIRGTIIAVIAIAIIMVFALRSLSLGALSLLPNGLPIATAFGAWALVVGEVGFSIAVVASIALGIVVDDTVHFLTKFVRARREKGLSPEDSIRYAFRNVGLAIVVNTFVLTIGFLVLTTSAFKVNVDMGLMTAFSIVFALILDFLLLPPLLLWRARTSQNPVIQKGTDDARDILSPAQ
ncbi:MAG: MMPL family transporter [Pseudomonadota bacterium]